MPAKRHWSLQGELGKSELTYVNRQHALKKNWLRRERSEHTRSQPVLPLHEQRQLGHDPWQLGNPVVCRLILRQIARFHSFRQRPRVLECHRDLVPGYCIGRSRRIADQYARVMAGGPLRLSR
jgi:hypothetical protein